MKLEELEVYIPKKKPPVNFKNLIGYETDYLKVISRAPNGPSHRTRWNCLCKACGEYCVKYSRNIDRDKSCGCLKKELIGAAQREDLTGKHFGKLLALKYAGYSNSSGNAVWICQCECGNQCEVDSNNLTSLHTTSCGCINYSIGIANIIKILEQNNILYQTEYTFQDLFNKSQTNPLRFDIAVLNSDNDIIRIVEYDGIQHFVNTWGTWKGRDTLQERQYRDKLKNIYCKEHNIPLVRIPYINRDKITLDMIMRRSIFSKRVAFGYSFFFDF